MSHIVVHPFSSFPTIAGTVYGAILSWDGFAIDSAKGDLSNVFGLAQFLSTLALLVVVFNVSDFRYRYRLSARRYNIRKIAIWFSGILAAVLVATEFWFENSFPIPHFLNHYGNIKIILASSFLIFVLYVVSACFLRPAIFRRSNALQFFQSTNHYIHQGNKDRLQAIAEELNYTMESVFRYASELPINPGPGPRPGPAPRIEQACAHDLLLTIADRRFCNIIVERNPSFAIRCFTFAEKYPGVPFTQFARNVGEEFIVNTEAAFYQEDSGYNSGYFGYAKPITAAVFGSYELVERCARQRASPLDLHYSLTSKLDAIQMEGLTRAGLSFFNSYLDKNGGKEHSYALARLLGFVESCASDIYKLNNSPVDGWKTSEYARFKAAADFIQRAANSLANSAIKPKSLRASREVFNDVYDVLAITISKLVFEASTVYIDGTLCWNIQHNVAWSMIFSNFRRELAFVVLRFKVRRLIYDEIVRNSTNFVGARYLGFCLHVCGLTAGERHQQFGREEYALRVCVINWTRRNYKHLLEYHPKVANACLQGSVTYDKDNHRLVRTFSDATQKEVPREYLTLE